MSSSSSEADELAEVNSSSELTAATASGDRAAASEPNAQAQALGRERLRGVRVLVPRGGAHGEKMAAEVAAFGAEPVIVPMIDFAPVVGDEAVELRARLAALAAGEYDWLAVTSPRNVEMLVHALGASAAAGGDGAGADTRADTHAEANPGLLIRALPPNPRAATRGLGGNERFSDREAAEASPGGVTAGAPAAADAVNPVPLIRALPTNAPAAARGLGGNERISELEIAAASAPCVGSDARTRLADAIPANTRVAAVGTGTAKALARHGVTADFVPAGEQSARGMIQEWPEPGARVLWPHSSAARHTIPLGVKLRGGKVDAPIAYHPASAPLSDDHLADLRAGRIPIALVTSGMIARELAHRLDGVRMPVVSIGPITTEDAREVGLPVVAEAAEPSIAAMLNALAKAAAKPDLASALPDLAAALGRRE
ncbi:uroporphyrinogen-III synthase [Gulosibacter macacae]|uniref:Uroporphyrinogen-III synthase n=1 Tax=Gulosibacter macacae TaxID=2488791 RepID=A0A3P3VY56_9MICO|nr:uroporphyrinogen-III synthase [Gulosibacter macacae]RRJ86968.1 uroporphyrinogen-III synthase [Gulosibacter macacae]